MGLGPHSLHSLWALTVSTSPEALHGMLHIFRVHRGSRHLLCQGHGGAVEQIETMNPGTIGGLRLCTPCRENVQVRSV